MGALFAVRDFCVGGYEGVQVIFGIRELFAPRLL